MTNAWGDVANTKMFMVLGSNFVENHPGVVQWANEAFADGAKFVCADPRRTRTVVWGETRASESAFAQVRPGTNGALLCGLINYAIANTDMDGVNDTTTATGTADTLTDTGAFGTTDYTGYYLRLTSAGLNPDWRVITSNDADSVTFSPAIDSAASINYAIGNYEICKKPLVDSVYAYNYTDAPYWLNNTDATSLSSVDYNRGNATGAPKFADSGTTTAGLTAYADKFSPNDTWDALNNGAASGSVFQHLATRMNQYTPSVVADICGISVSEFNALAAMVTDPANRPGCIMYAMGGTQHTSAAQDLRAYCILQCLLGNIGKSGSGVNALRGIHNVQGSTDQGVLYSSMPGYSDVPDANSGNTTYYDYQNGLFGNSGGDGLQQKGFTNMMGYYFMQASGAPALTHGGTSYGSSAVNWNFNLLAQGNGFNHRTMFQRMKSGATTSASNPRVKFLMCLGQNPAVTEPNLSEIRAGLKDVETLVCVDLYASETATCERAAGTMTFLLPSCAHTEEAGTVTSSARMLYWRYMASPAKGNSKTDLETLLLLAKKLDDKGAFAHIKTANFDAAHASASVYEILYGRQYHPWAPTAVPSNWTTQYGSETHGNGLPRYVGEAVAEEVFKQMAAGRTGVTNPRAYSTTDATWSKAYGALWIYADGYQQLSNADYCFGGQLNTAAAAGTSSLVVKSAHRALMGIAAGKKFIVGNIGSRGTGDTETTADGGNEEVVTVAGTYVAGSDTVPIVETLDYDHAANEPMTANGAWSVDARDGIMPKSRSTYDPGRNKIYGRFGWAWLYNRHIFYNANPCGTQEYWTSYGSANQPGSEAFQRPPGGPNYNQRYYRQYLTACEDTCPNRPASLGGNGSCKAPGDTHDYIVAPDARCRLFVHHKSVAASHTPAIAHNDAPPIQHDTISKLYRKYSALADWDHHDAAGSTEYPQRPARFPKHWEPHETPDASAESTYGHSGDNPLQAAGDRNYYPLVLTTWRVCWHFQGGPMSRNVPWLAELDPKPYIEINASDAATYGIASGDNVYVHTTRANNCGPFTARVGTGTQTTQNTKEGVVGIPWHWGRNLGMASGSGDPLVDGASANEVTIDALDTNIKMPESKACLCVITKTTV